MVPPYCGLPSESHQWPVGADVTVDLDVTTAEVVVVELVGTTVEVVFVVVVVVVVLELLQDARMSDVTMRHPSAVQINPFFKVSSFYFIEYIWKVPMCSCKKVVTIY